MVVVSISLGIMEGLKIAALGRDDSYSCTDVGDSVVAAHDEGEIVKVVSSVGMIVIDGTARLYAVCG